MRGDSRHAQLNVQWAEFPELDLAVLRLALLGNIQVAHDLEARHQGIAVGGWHFDVVEQRTVLAHQDLGLGFSRSRFDVYV